MNVAEIVTSKITDRMSKGFIPWFKPWKVLPAFNAVSGEPYRGINALLLGGMSDYPTPIFLSFKQAKELGGYVKKGEKSYLAVFYTRYESKEKEPKEGEREDAPGKVRSCLRYYNVFNVSQCEGVVLPKKARERIAAEYQKRKEGFSPIESARAIWDGYKGRPNLKHASQDKAFYSDFGDFIQIPPEEAFDSAGHYYKVLFHEAIHSTGAEKRLDRKVFKEYHSDKAIRSREELVAEIGGCSLASMAGIESADLIEESAAYCQSWSQFLQSDPQAIIIAAAQAQKAMDFITAV